jgi:hypothetical protein
VRTAPN